MKITFQVENCDYDEYVYIMCRDVAENYVIKPGDILEEVQLHAYFIDYWNKKNDGKKTKNFNI